MFSINLTGTREGLIKRIKAFKLPDNADKAAADANEKQLAAAKVFLVAEIMALPADVTGAQVHAEADTHPQGRKLNASITAKEIHV